MRRYVTIVGLLVATAACGGTGSSPSTVALGEQTFDALDSPVLSAQEINAITSGEAPGPEFNSDPATSGPHADAWARCGVYRQPIPDIYLVSSLRRGAVVIHYQPALEPAEVAAIDHLVSSIGEGVISAPRPGLESPIVLAAWTTLLALPSVDEVVVRAFAEQFGHRAPDDQDCPLEIDEAA